MKGLELSRKYYEHCRPRLYEDMPQVMEKACAGLCGEGSECFGCDDEISRDHDFSPAFCLWLPKDTLFANSKLINRVFKKLPEIFDGMPVYFNARRGPLSVEHYYRFFTELDYPPQTWREWLNISENQLASAVNGEIFEDNGELFSEWRKKLQYYPEDIRLKKLAASTMQMAQSGQYNLGRCLARGETQAAFLAMAKFMEAAIAFVFLANKKYMPFYKWAPRLAKNLPILGKELKTLLDNISSTPVSSPNAALLAESIESFCSLCAEWLNATNLSPVKDNWLWAHGPEIIRNVENPEIRNLNLLKDGL